MYFVGCRAPPPRRPAFAAGCCRFSRRLTRAGAPFGRREVGVDAPVSLGSGERLQLRAVGVGLEGGDGGRPLEPGPEDKAYDLGVVDDVVEEPPDVAGKIVGIEGHLLNESWPNVD
jgi:hypothetical protein